MGEFEPQSELDHTQRCRGPKSRISSGLSCERFAANCRQGMAVPGGVNAPRVCPVGRCVACRRPAPCGNPTTGAPLPTTDFFPCGSVCRRIRPSHCAFGLVGRGSAACLLGIAAIASVPTLKAPAGNCPAGASSFSRLAGPKIIPSPSCRHAFPRRSAATSTTRATATNSDDRHGVRPKKPACTWPRSRRARTRLLSISSPGDARPGLKRSMAPSPIGRVPQPNFRMLT